MARRRKLRHTVSHSTAERCGLGTRGQWPARSVRGVQRIGGGAGWVPRLGVGLSLTWVRPPPRQQAGPAGCGGPSASSQSRPRRRSSRGGCSWKGLGPGPPSMRRGRRAASAPSCP
eukprot:scaffold73085_cov63-Phaeocystis_antarctica.AAC.3